MPRRPHDNTVARPIGRTSLAKKPTVAFATLQFGRSWCHDYPFLVAVCAVVRQARRISAPPQDESTPDVLDPRKDTRGAARRTARCQPWCFFLTIIRLELHVGWYGCLDRRM
jgi:hypothetical protein